MKSSDLNNLLTGVDTGKELQKAIQDEVASYSNLMKKQGASNPIYFWEDHEILITVVGLERLLRATIEGNLSTVSLSYVCDCLTLGEKIGYQKENLMEIVHEIADSEINHAFQTIEDIRHLIARLR
jgi:hypothetical protein